MILKPDTVKIIKDITAKLWVVLRPILNKEFVGGFFKIVLADVSCAHGFLTDWLNSMLYYKTKLIEKYFSYFLDDDKRGDSNIDMKRILALTRILSDSWT